MCTDLLANEHSASQAVIPRQHSVGKDGRSILGSGVFAVGKMRISVATAHRPSPTAHRPPAPHPTQQ